MPKVTKSPTCKKVWRALRVLLAKSSGVLYVPCVSYLPKILACCTYLEICGTLRPLCVKITDVSLKLYVPKKLTCHTWHKYQKIRCPIHTKQATVPALYDRN